MLVDASIAIKCYVAEPDSERADALFADFELVAPDLIVAEMGNALWKTWRRGVLSADAARMALENLLERIAVLHPIVPLGFRAAEIAQVLDHPVYDCIYLACAEREDDILVTADERLLRAVAGSPWEPLCRPLTDGFKPA